MFGEKPPDVLIIGAGPVGEFAALDLARRGVRVRIVDRGIWPCVQSYALTLHPQSLELLQDFGLLDEIIDGATLVRSLAFYEGPDRRAEVHLAQDAGPLGALAVIRQDALEGLLEAALKVAGVEVEWRHELSRITPHQGHADVSLDKFEKESRGYVVTHTEWVVSKSTNLRVPFVVGADGYNSRVRRALQLDFSEVGPAQYYAVFETECDADLGHEMRIVLGDRTTDVLWPLPGGFCRWSFELPDYADPKAEHLKQDLLSAGFDFPAERSKDRIYMTEGIDTPVLDESNLRALIAERAPWFTPSPGEIVWRSVVRFERRLVPRFGQGPLWLAGDSAHLTGPVGVQSMNLGLAEAFHLAETLHGVLRNPGRAPVGLEAYSRQWTATWRQLHHLEGGLRAGPDTPEWVARHVVQLTSCLPAHGPALASLAGQLGLTLAQAATA